MIVAGVGCRRETTADELENVVRMALGHVPARRPSGSEAVADRVGEGD